MNKTSQIILGILALLLIGTSAYFFALRAKGPTTGAPGSTTPTSTAPSSTIEYQNNIYGFTFALPKSWTGYKIVTSTWRGYKPGPGGEVAVTSGPQLAIRHPLWTMQKPRQDIPIMIFTLSQWQSLQNDGFSVSAAPINPSELDRNNLYVFALPARYNYAFPEGFQEVENILQDKPLKAFSFGTRVFIN